MCSRTDAPTELVDPVPPCRGCAKITALSAFWVGLLYDPTSLDAAWDIVKGWTADERQELRNGVPKEALDARFRRHKVLDLAREALAVSRHGLAARRKVDDKGQDETRYVDCLETIAGSGRTTADEMLGRFNGNWAGQVDPVYAEFAYKV